MGLADIIGGAFSGLAGDPYGYQRTKQAQQSSQLYNLLSQLKIGETLRGLGKQIQWEKGLQEIPLTEEVPESDEIRAIAQQYGTEGMQTVPRPYSDIRKDIAQLGLSLGEYQPYLDLGKERKEEEEYEYKKSLWPLEKQQKLVDILYKAAQIEAEKQKANRLNIGPYGIFVPDESSATSATTPSATPQVPTRELTRELIQMPLTPPSAGPGQRAAAIDKIRAEVQAEAAQAQAQAQGNQPLPPSSSMKQFPIPGFGTFYVFPKESTDEMRTIYGPGGKTKVIPIEKGKIVEPPPGWSFKPPEKTEKPEASKQERFVLVDDTGKIIDEKWINVKNPKEVTDAVKQGYYSVTGMDILLGIPPWKHELRKKAEERTGGKSQTKKGKEGTGGASRGRSAPRTAEEFLDSIEINSE